MFWNSVLILFLTLALLNSCSGITMLTIRDRSDLYSPQFMQKVDRVKKIYREGQRGVALANLKALNDETLNPSEKAMKRNLVGVILFSKGSYEQAVQYFDQALETSRQDLSLTSQIRLNLASSYFKLGFQDKAYEALLASDFRFLSSEEAQKYHKLRYKLGKELGKDRDPVISLVRSLGFKNKISDLKSDIYYEVLMSEFIKLDRKEKFSILEELESEKTLVTGYLGYLEAEKLYYSGNRDEAEDLLEWVKDHFANHSEIQFLIGHFDFRMEAFAKLDSKSIGLLLPLTGPKRNFGLRALKGFDAALRKSQEDRKGEELPYQVHVKDSKGSGVVGTHAVRELVEKSYVSIIVGGLFANEAEKEYLEARKLGVFFISLSQIYLPKEKKDHLLLEVPGSVESMVNVLFSDDHMERFGKKAAIIYPQTDRGEAFVDEFWRKASLAGVKVTDVLSYKKKTNDYRKPVKKLLGLEYIRERQEEYDLLEKVYALEKHHSMRRIQILKPQVDFDWVFIPAFPLEAIQIIPSFTYFDAFNVNVIGGPSWRSKRLSRESHKFKNIHFLGDDVTESSKDFSHWFYKEYGQRGSLIEMMAFDSFQVADFLLKQREFQTRDELDIYIRGLREFGGLTGNWKQSDGLWLKNMVSLHLRSGKIAKSSESKSNN